LKRQKHYTWWLEPLKGVEERGVEFDVSENVLTLLNGGRGSLAGIEENSPRL
jgi:hypothetical protein